MVLPFIPTPGSLPRRTPPLLQVLALWVETLIASGVYTPHSKGTRSPSYQSGAPTAGWWICLPQGPALAIRVGSLSRPYALPLSTLAPRCAETSCGASQGHGGYLPPTQPAPQGTVQHPLIILFLVQQALPCCLLFGSKGLVPFASIFLH